MHMNDQQLDDLKQFIAATVSQTEARLDGRIDGLRVELCAEINGLRGDLVELRNEMHEGFAGVGDALDAMSGDFDTRLTHLEKSAA